MTGEPLASRPAPLDLWFGGMRALVFVCAATSIWCLLAEFYGLCSMRTFTLFVSVPALLLLTALAFADLRLGTRELWTACLVGSFAGFVAAVAYDLFRLPFVFAKPLGIDSWIPALPLFKVFPRFGAMILGQATEQVRYSWTATLLGWAYHFSNGMTFGIMFLAAVGHPTRRAWIWSIGLAAGLEAGMLFTPYPGVFGIRVSGTFVAVTLMAHVLFGLVLGLVSRRLWPS